MYPVARRRSCRQLPRRGYSAFFRDGNSNTPCTQYIQWTKFVDALVQPSSRSGSRLRASPTTRMPAVYVVFTDCSGSFVCSTPNGVEMSENVPWGLRKVSRCRTTSSDGWPQGEAACDKGICDSSDGIPTSERADSGPRGATATASKGLLPCAAGTSWRTLGGPTD